ncbi:E3 ubiquitin-protein ligase RNF43 [Protopterus annectens]|uniref:E3 ubiquitin-protein ligase RNF43 n=1 Tax=Protopterus annectens TaxID=7888 RepID=UPI001CFA3D65|nr:E3 ubiquitin-protein ligase RNF43 [Protopterus annectens]
MTVFLQKQAVLWPWLLMAALQAGLGQTGLVLAAAVETERSAPKAIIKVIPRKLDPTGKYNLTLEGVFAGPADVTSADGKLLQFHPLSLCNTSEEEDLKEHGFVTIVKLESPDRDPHPCLSLLNKARLAMDRGATAVIFDITDDDNALEQLNVNVERYPPHPVVLIQGKDAELLMDVVNNNQQAQVKIEMKKEPPKKDYDVGIVLTLVAALTLIILIFTFRVKCRQNQNQDSMHQQTLRAISRLATRKYKSRCRSGTHKQHGGPDSGSSCSSAPTCAVCLEEFVEGQDLRIISCLHEFHKQCVDPWLILHRTCPLCMYNIMDGASVAQQYSHSRSAPDSDQSHHVQLLQPYPQHAFTPRPHNAAGTGLYHQRSSRLATTLQPPGMSYFLNSEVSQIDCNTIRYVPCRQLATPSQCGLHRNEQQGIVYGHQQSTNHYRMPMRWPETTFHQRPCGSQPLTPAVRPWNLQSTKIHRPGATAAVSHGTGPSRQDDGSSGGSFRTERSGYLPDGPGSDSSSGPCHGSSSDSVQNCTDVSLQGVYGSWSTFRSSLSSDFDPFIYCGPGQPPAENQEGSYKGLRPRSLDSIVNREGSVPDSQVFSHVHYHHHRHHHYRGNQQSTSGIVDHWSLQNSQEESRYSGAREGMSHNIDKVAPQKQRTTKGKQNCTLPLDNRYVSQCVSHSGKSRCLHHGHDLLEPTFQAGESSFEQSGLCNAQTSAPCCTEQRNCNRKKHHRRKRSSQRMPSVDFLHKEFDQPEDCNIHVHYGPSSSYCCLPEMQPLVQRPLILDSGATKDCPLQCWPGPLMTQDLQMHHLGTETQLQSNSLPQAVEYGPTFQSGLLGLRPSDQECFCCRTQHNHGSDDGTEDVCEHTV